MSGILADEVLCGSAGDDCCEQSTNDNLVSSEMVADIIVLCLVCCVLLFY